MVFRLTNETMKNILFLTLYLLLAPLSSFGSNNPEACPDGDRAVTKPAPVVISSVLESMASLKTTEGKPAHDLSTELVRKVHDIFDHNKVKTKMAQFYSLLYVINEQIPIEQGKSVSLDGSTTRPILIKSAVFTDPEIPNHIQKVTIDRSKLDEPKYEVTFDQDQTLVPLNKGEGFYLFRNGLCQHAQKLIFQKTFTVSLYINSKGNLVAKNFKGVDLFGAFGNRGLFDVDINYVELRSVEFYKGTPDGKVTVYVSKEEFKKNEHNPILRFITRLVPDRTIQPIDW